MPRISNSCCTCHCIFRTRLVGDPLRLSQVLTNLAENAVKFTEEGEVDISVSILEQTEEKTKLRFDVRDTGIGMSEDQTAKLFRGLQPGGQLHHEKIWRDRSGVEYLQTPRWDDGRRDHG